MAITAPQPANTIGTIAPDGASGSPVGGRSNHAPNGLNFDSPRGNDGLQTVIPSGLGVQLNAQGSANLADPTSNPVTCDSSPTVASVSPSAPNWAAQAWPAGSVIKPTTNNAGGYAFFTSAGGTSSGSAPTFPQTVYATVTDSGGVIWENVGFLGRPVCDSEGAADPCAHPGRVN